jgi:two-component system chemotaxis response regulator CheB
MGKRTLIVIGASAGGVPALRHLTARLPADLPAAILIVLHIGSYASILPELLNSDGPLPAKHAEDGEPVVHGRIYVAPPDHHMLLDDEGLRLSRGPKEHHTRPAIDPLFRSAALTHGAAVIGVVLTGMMDDGTAGLQAVKARGGIAVVQDPADAFEPSMPLSALKYVRVDHVATLQDMPDLLARLVTTDTAAASPPPPSQLTHEHQLSLVQGVPMEHLHAIAKPSTFVCPDCHGSLWEINGSRPTRYRCHVGHAYTLRTLEHAQSDATGDALWSAIRALEEKQMLLRRLADEHRRDRDDAEALRLMECAEDTQRHAEMLLKLVETVPGTSGQVVVGAE